MAAIRNDKDIYLQQSPLRLRTMPLPSSVTIDFGAVQGTSDLVNTANLALETANDINGKIADIASDNKLTLDEKSALKGTWDGIYKERDSVVQTANTLFVNSTYYQASYNDLYNYLQPVLGLNATNTTFNNGSTVSNINGNDLRQNVATYFSERQKIINAGSLAASKKADWSSIINDNNLKPQDGADKTSSNISAGFANQGTLAIKDSVGYIDVSGTKPPIDADKTSSNISAGFNNQGSLAIKNRVSSGDINANAINSNHIQTNAITANKLSADAVQANSISTNAMDAIIANVGTLVVGDIIGTQNINITGSAVFNGSYTAGGRQYAVVANNNIGQTGGIAAYSKLNGYAVYGISTGASGNGVRGYALGNSGIGVYGTTSSSSGFGGFFRNSGGGFGLGVSGHASITGNLTSTNIKSVRNGYKLTGNTWGNTGTTTIGGISVNTRQLRIGGILLTVLVP